MDYQRFEKEVLDLYAAERFDAAEERKMTAIPWLKQCLKTDFAAGNRILTLFSELAGEAESFNHLCNLLDDLKKERLVSEVFAEELIKSAPANRWL